MTTPSTLEAFDLIRFSEQLAQRLVAAQAVLEKRRALGEEKEWMSAAVKRVDAAREGASALLERARDLPELEEIRGEFAGVLQGAFVDLLEKLLAGITFHVGPRDPVIEALFPHQKVGTLRRAPRDTVQDFFSEFERRGKSSYLNRMLQQEGFAFARPVLDQIREGYARWQSSFAAAGLPEEVAAPIREELFAMAGRLEVAMRQAKLLAEAALVPVHGAFEENGLSLKPRKRAGKAAQSLEDVAASLPEEVAAATPAPVVAPEAVAKKEKREKVTKALQKVDAAQAPAAAPVVAEPVVAPVVAETVAVPLEGSAPAVKVRKRKAAATVETTEVAVTTTTVEAPAKG